jgi:spermidine synthase
MKDEVYIFYGIILGMKHGSKNSELKEIREFHSPSSGLFFTVRRQLHSEVSPYQKIEVYENDFFGNILFLDGLVQTTEKDEYFYHEMLTHPAMMSHPAPGKCLIIGGGDGGTLKEVLRYPIKKVWLVEIDPRVIEVCQKYYPWLNEALKDDRAELVTTDGNEFIAATAEKFDVVLIDSSEPVGPSSVLHGGEFYQKLKHCLNPGGIIVAQAGSPVFHFEHLKQQSLMLRDIYPVVNFYCGPAPTYPGGSWCYVCLSESRLSWNKKQSPPAGLKYYTNAIHEVVFALPGFLKDLSG